VTELTTGRLLLRPFHPGDAPAVHAYAEFGYVLARSAWGRGYATEAATAVLAYAFGHLGLHRVAATCDPANTGSRHVLEKTGLQYEGHLHDYLYIRGEWRDRLLFAACRPAR
jgi:ribosomal-protein-alanine N-acetyltransferase